jgi:hypothetical protein
MNLKKTLIKKGPTLKGGLNLALPKGSDLIGILVITLSYLSLTSPIHAEDWVALNSECVDTGVATIKGIECLVINLLSPLPYIIGLVAFITIIFAGARIISAGADAKALASAWSQFRWAVIGIILLSAAWLILLTIEAFTGAKVTEFGFN